MRNRKHGEKKNDPIWLHGADLIRAARTRARKTGVPCDLPFSWAAQRLEDGHCEVTGVPFKLGAGPREANSPSIDRIVPELGYVESNCRMVIWMYNAAKSEYTDEAVWNMATSLAREINFQNFKNHLKLTEAFI